MSKKWREDGEMTLSQYYLLQRHQQEVFENTLTVVEDGREQQQRGQRHVGQCIPQ